MAANTELRDFLLLGLTGGCDLPTVRCLDVLDLTCPGWAIRLPQPRSLPQNRRQQLEGSMKDFGLCAKLHLMPQQQVSMNLLDTMQGGIFWPQTILVCKAVTWHGSARPSSRPSSRPSRRPSSRPSRRPSSRPRRRPSSRPSSTSRMLCAWAAPDTARHTTTSSASPEIPPYLMRLQPAEGQRKDVSDPLAHSQC